ncbi:LuxR C-terminal-related transcriptional regulator [Microbacterium sp. NPDC089695]|uniref:LuxR C-terminal-related transcriptional regulator n=1 Tax=Microbacterium sp. NPDC089695 TaxID=3364198 RepID=UPI00380AD768
MSPRDSRAIDEHLDDHAVTLESILATLRSPRLDDHASRTTAIEIATSALIRLRSAADDRQRSLLEPVTRAFERLQATLRPLMRYGDLDVQFVEPPRTGRALPGEIAFAARAIVRSAVLAIVDHGEAKRVRIQWDCDGLNLLIRIRDDGRGRMSARDEALRPITERVVALDGQIEVSSTDGWGSEIAITVPLDPPAAQFDGDLPTEITEREREVLQLLVGGNRNRDIARTLSISENTAKFHVSNLLRKTGCSSRAQLVARTRG